MKVVLILLIASFAFADPETKDVETPIEDIIEKIRKAIPEPIKLDKYVLAIPDNIFVSGSLNVTNLAASGLKAFTFHEKLLSFKMGLEKFTFDTEYAMELPLLKIPLLSIFGDGTISIVLSNLNINFVVDLLGFGGEEFLKSFEMDIKNIEFAVTGVMDDVDLSKNISDLINKNTIEIFNNYSKDISELIRKVLNKVIYAIINKNEALSAEEGAGIAYKNEYLLTLWKAVNHLFV